MIFIFSNISLKWVFSNIILLLCTKTKRKNLDLDLLLFTGSYVVIVLVRPTWPLRPRRPLLYKTHTRLNQCTRSYLLRYGAPVFLLASWSQESAITWWMLGRLLGSGSSSFFSRQMAAERRKKKTKTRELNMDVYTKTIHPQHKQK